jgi:hypothetical protein
MGASIYEAGEAGKVQLNLVQGDAVSGNASIYGSIHLWEHPFMGASIYVVPQKTRAEGLRLDEANQRNHEPSKLRSRSSDQVHTSCIIIWIVIIFGMTWSPCRAKSTAKF